jgi:site-specific DNA-adenine methylase
MQVMQVLKALFPWFGGKSRVATEVWQRFGDVPNYVEPFFGSGAVLLGRLHEPHIETINDKDGFVANFWRATKADPEAVAHYADWARLAFTSQRKPGRQT